jgi:AraC-like DNA-binding protein
MLTDTRHPIAEVALRTGFSSPSTLSRAFRARFGQPPGQLAALGLFLLKIPLCTTLRSGVIRTSDRIVTRLRITAMSSWP